MNQTDEVQQQSDEVVREEATVSVPFCKNQSFSDATIDALKCQDYQQLFQHDFDERRRQGRVAESAVMPQYTSFKDNLVMVQTQSEEAEVLYVPYEHY